MFMLLMNFNSQNKTENKTENEIKRGNKLWGKNFINHL